MPAQDKCDVLSEAKKGIHSKLLCAGAKRLVPEAWRKWPLFDNIFRLKGVPVITVQLRYDGWITELQDQSKMQDLSHVSPHSSSMHPAFALPEVCSLPPSKPCAAALTGVMSKAELCVMTQILSNTAVWRCLSRADTLANVTMAESS